MKERITEPLRISKKSLMKHANEIAKGIVAKVGDYRVAMKLAMKYVWAEAKRTNKKYFTSRSVKSAVYTLSHRKYDPRYNSFGGVYSFFIDEKVEAGDITQAQYQAYNCHPEGTQVVRETAKAVMIRFNTIGGSFTIWTPKAMLVKEF